ncbi:MAG: sigma-54-dependent Fis family transcriptional regulator [Pseudobacteriovorax sp.]|nr:sigma-54-dependent Fis family transcriptional regulator [Pseudobacteriovorax sp.]
MTDLILKRSILLVEDSLDQARRYEKLLANIGSVLTVNSYDDARKALDGEHFTTLITDVHLEGENSTLDFRGLDLIHTALQGNPDVLIIVMSADPELTTYKRAMSGGADVFIKKPIISSDEFAIALESAETHRRTRKAQKSRYLLGEDQQDSERFKDGVVLPSLVRKMTENVAKSQNLPVVIYGETGTGKEEVAKIIHKRRQENEGPLPFVPVNCANLNGDTAVSRIFGHRKGAFTGANETTSGFVGDANGGILFLDEIHRLDEECQARLLRILNDGSYERLGESKTLYSKFQVIVASNKDLDELVEEGLFLMDLRSRLIGLDINLDPLRKRLDDIGDLISLFAKKDGYHIEPLEFQKLVEKCQSYHWQGNIRQLYNVIRSHVTLCQLNERPITVEGFPEFKSMLAPNTEKSSETIHKSEAQSLETHQPQADEQELSPEDVDKILEPLKRDCVFKDAIDTYERLILEAAMTRHPNLAQVSSALQIGRSSLDVRRKKFDLKY